MIWSDAQINHYWTRDENFFHNIKLPRREKWYGVGSAKGWGEGMNQCIHPRGDHILRFIPPLRKAMEYDD